MAIYILAIIISYFIGNISPAIILGKIYGVDIKKEGSGNAGTTNALRVLGKKAGVITLLVDVLKGVIVVLIAKHLFWNSEPIVALLCALAVFCGHIWPVIFGFKGGKGVATAFGIIVAVHWCLGLAALAIVLLVVVITKRMSAGSIAGAISVPILAYFLTPVDVDQLTFVLWAVILGAIVIIKHRANLVRLFKGEEPKLNFKK
jgi:glycerol-3-phosphate acyltransferase PlsY